MSPPRLALGLTLALLSACASEPRPEPAPVPAGPPPLRVSVDLACDVEGKPAAPDGLQYTVWERLHHFGLRVDAARPVGDARLDAVVQAAADAWERDQPGQAPATLRITGRSACDYADAAFFGQPQAHTFRGRADVELAGAAPAPIDRAEPAGESGPSSPARLERRPPPRRSAGEHDLAIALGLAHEWGRLPQRHTKASTLDEYHQMVHLPVAMWLLRQPAIAAGVPEAKRAELEAWIAETRARLLRPLGDMECDVATLLKGLGPATPR